MIEMWKSIENYPNYEVSNTGRVRSLKRKINDGIMNGGLKPKHYRVVRLSLNRVKFSKSVHRIVAIAFIPNPDNKPQVNHINGDVTDNRVENLEWVTGSENLKHAYRTGLLKISKERREATRLKMMGNKHRYSSLP